MNVVLKPKTIVYDIVVNVLCLLQLVGVVIYLIAVWKGLPDRLPWHYDAAGVVDDWRDKGYLIVLPIVTWVVYIMITVIERFPQIWNSGIRITEENKERVFSLLKNMIATIKLVVVTLLSFLALHATFEKNLPVWFLPVALILVFGTIIFFIVKLIRAR